MGTAGCNLTNTARVPHIPDFLCGFVGAANSIRLSLKKGAHAVVSRAAYRKFGVSRSFFARCGRPRTLTVFQTLERNTWRAVVSLRPHSSQADFPPCTGGVPSITCCHRGTFFSVFVWMICVHRKS